MKWRQGAEGKTKFLEEEERQEWRRGGGGARGDKVIMVPYTVNGGLVKKFPRLTYKNDNKNAIADVRKEMLEKTGNQVDGI